jgi:hypothetical protein
MARIEEVRNYFRILIGKLEGKYYLGDAMRRWRDFIKVS